MWQRWTDLLPWAARVLARWVRSALVLNPRPCASVNGTYGPTIV